MKPVLVLRKENWKMKERIAVLRKTLGLTQKQFGEQIGVQRGTIANYELGRNIPTETVRLMICRVYGVRREWLETGEGEIFDKKTRYDQIREMADEYMKDESESFRNRLISVISELSEEQLVVLAEIAEKIVKS
jgi:transcriptional regulator with XRE-family HTH domain